MKLLLAAALFVPSLASAQTVAAHAAGGWDQASRQWWTALDVSAEHDQTYGGRFVGRLQAGWGFGDARPTGRLELGGMAVVPAERATVRVGGMAGVRFLNSPLELPLSLGGDADAGGEFALLPYAVGRVEVGGRRPSHKGVAAWALGARLGAGVHVVPVGCGESGEQVCTDRPRAGIEAAVTGRVWFHEHVHLELWAGPVAYVGIGFRLGGDKAPHLHHFSEEIPQDPHAAGPVEEPRARRGAL